MNPRDRVRLRHLADALNSALRFVQGRERGDLDADEMLLLRWCAPSRSPERQRAKSPPRPVRNCPICRRIQWSECETGWCTVTISLRISLAVPAKAGIMIPQAPAFERVFPTVPLREAPRRLQNGSRPAPGKRICSKGT